MAGPPDSERLQALKRLDEVLERLERLVLKCAREKRVTESDETQHTKLVGEAQILHGGLSRLLGVAVMEQFGQRWDPRQLVLANSSISRLLSPYSTVDIWYESLKAARSNVRQTLGRLEEMERRGRLALSPDVVARYRTLITWTEAIRHRAGAAIRWVSQPVRVVDPIVRRLENWLPIRLVRLAGGLVAGMAVIAGGVTAVWYFLL